MPHAPDGGHTMTDYEAERGDFALVAPPDFNWAVGGIDRQAHDRRHHQRGDTRDQLRGGEDRGSDDGPVRQRARV